MLTERSAGLGQVAELHFEDYTLLRIGGRNCCDLTPDIATIGIGWLEESFIGKSSLINQPGWVVGHGARLGKCLHI